MPVYMCILPAEKIGIAVMTNSWEAGTLHGTIAARILDTLLGIDPGKDPAPPSREIAAAEMERVPNTTPSRPLDAYAGTYTDVVHGDLVIKHENGRLTLQFAGDEQADLEHWHRDVFRVRWRDRVYEWADTYAAFALDAGGNPMRFDMTLYRDTIEAVRNVGRPND
jgi:hypothetical protein